MTWTAPTDRATGFLVTAAVYNTEIIDNMNYLHGDSGATIDLSAGGQFLLASGLQVGANDLSLNRIAAGLLKLSSSTAGKGNIQLGAVSGNIGAGTATPDAANFVTRWNATATGTVTIAAPLNPPGANQTAVIVIIINNASAGSVTLAYNAAFKTNGTSASVAAGAGVAMAFYWNPGISKWILLASDTDASGL
jgi:hypothetical protein